MTKDDEKFLKTVQEDRLGLTEVLLSMADMLEGNARRIRDQAKGFASDGRLDRISEVVSDIAQIPSQARCVTRTVRLLTWK